MEQTILETPKTTQPRPKPAAHARGPSLISIAGSLWFAALLLMLLLVGMACATMYESARGTEQALIVFYGSWWFKTLCALLGVNILASALMRYPFTRKHIGFLTTHGGLLAIMIGAVVTMVWGIDGQLSVIEGQTASEVRVAQDTLTLVDRRTQTRTALELTDRGFGGLKPAEFDAPPQLVKDGLTIAVMRYLPDSEAVETVVNDNPRYQPAVEFSLSEVAEPTWLFANQRTTLGSITATLRTARDAQDLARLLAAPSTVSAMTVEIIAGPGGETHARFSVPGANAQTVKLNPGEPVATPWNAMQLTLHQRFDHARIDQPLEPVMPVRKMRMPAALLRLTSGKEQGEMWVQRGVPRSVSVNGAPHQIIYGDKTVDLGFSVKLDDFRIVHYPGGRQPRAFESTVTVTNPETGYAREHVVSMNRPIKYGGFTLYQSSYREGRGAAMSVLSVSRDPGQWIVFAGYIFTTIGMIIVLSTRLNERRRFAKLAAARRSS